MIRRETTMPPLSPMQLGMLYHHLVDEREGLDILQVVVELPEPVDAELLRESWQCVVDRHVVLHSAVARDGRDRPVWRAADAAMLPFEVSDWSAVTPETLDERFEDLLERDRSLGFRLDRPPLTRIQLIRLGPEEYRCIWTLPHLVLDAGSFVQVLREVWTLYDAGVDGTEGELPPVRAYPEYLEWRTDHEGEGDEEFWSDLLAGFASPADVSSGGEADGGTLEISRRLPEGLTEELRKVAEAHDVRLSTVILSAWAVLLHRFTGETDVIFGQTRSGRPQTVEGAEEMVGLFINSIPTRTHVDPQRPVAELLREVRDQQVEVRPHEHAALTDIQKWSDLPPNTPLFQSIVVFDRESLGSRVRKLGGRWHERDACLRERLSSDLNVHVYGEDPMLMVAVADGESFGRERTEALLDGLAAVLRAIADRPDVRVGELPLLTGEQRSRMLVEWNDTARPLPDERRIHEQFRAVARARPDAPAVKAGSSVLTYQELDARSNQLARHLAEMGVRPDTLVGLIADRSPDTVVGLLGILKAGGAYVPLDPDFPGERIAFMLEDSGVDVLVTPRRHVAALPEHRARVVHVDADGRAFEEEDTPLDSDVSAEHLAYVMYTSGSTGRPKGVAVEHRNVTAFFTAMDERLEPDDTDPGVWLSVTTLSFDISVLELLWTLTRGFEVVLFDDERGTVEAARKAAPSTEVATRPMEFSLFYFAADEGSQPDRRYELLLEGARFADRNGFAAVWMPERHFHAFGGLYPNPSVTGAAVAAITERVGIRSGSVVLPLHHPARVVEEWSVVDNLSGGRVGLSFASGWQADDFCLRPDNYEDRKSCMYEAIETVRRLWRGEAVTFPGPKGDVEVSTLPRPIQEELPVWITTAGSVSSFESAGRIGANILTHLLGQSVEEIREKIAVYRDARQKAGHEGPGCVSLMLHTFVGGDDDEVRERVREPMKSYLRTAVGLIRNFQQAWEIYAGRQEHQNDEGGFESLSDDDLDSLLDFAFERYYESSGLFGSVERCVEIVGRLRAAGVDEIACLIDFGVDTSTTLEHLEHLAELRRRIRQARPDREPSGFADQVHRHGVTHLQCTPSRARIFLADPEAREAFAKLDTVLVGGEALPGPLATRLREFTGGRILNMYGPTETTIWSSVHDVGPDDTQAVVAIGRPIANTRLYVVDSALNPVPPGVPGELIIGGEGVVRGYLDRPELTSERFIPDPFVDAPNARVYRTGDRVRYRADGVIDFLGRLDDQVKIRGHRIELGEIDSVLTARDDVDAAVSVVHEPTHGDHRLVSYYVSGRRGPDFEVELRESLSRVLPEVMVPSILVGLDALPTTPNGKLDRNALPDPGAGSRSERTPGVGPRNEMERRIAAIWARELGVDSLQIDENFFDAGGHSLLAVQVQARLQADLERKIPLTDLFRFSTIRTLAEHLVEAGDDRPAAQEGMNRAAMRRRSRRGRTAGSDRS
ncbi:MAG: LLM class flavin-dependent oxidoreductase [Longimicrobiales bacterium]|nr:LLM class flavin-dependent oxidoreductase [Longimicrobiales bacterium]